MTLDADFGNRNEPARQTQEPPPDEVDLLEELQRILRKGQ
jgi:hypothetical protein